MSGAASLRTIATAHALLQDHLVIRLHMGKRGRSVDRKAQSRQLTRLFTVPGGALFYLVIPKCGCTFVKNVLWEIHHGTRHPKPKRIHDADDAFLRAPAVVQNDKDVIQSERAFVVLRNPIDRFLSLYFDKVIGDGWQTYVPLRQTLIDHYGLDPAPATLHQHRENCARLVRFLADNLGDGAHLPREAHWTPQSDRQNIMKRFDLKILLTDQLTDHMNSLLAGLNPHYAQIVARAEQYGSGRQALGRSVLHLETRKRINTLYARDRSIYKSARGLWHPLKSRGDCLEQIPRYSHVLSAL